ncbi:hypothetical protein QYE76_042052 [Lolium multiflorum]|uniref:Transposase-associated domain-containing protein n=1 Tax=Lolium multiflorum TaxID=4521 RepID=A0AAD8TEI8_LOLMU|nr:hypothetical protein QYE76_042052 [Lolium multiflorum]
MTPAKRNLPANALDNPAWARWFEDKRAVELARAAERASGRFNNIGRRAGGTAATSTPHCDNTASASASGRPAARPVYFPRGVHGAGGADSAEGTATMVRMMSEGVVARFLKAATAGMIRNNQKEIRCPCRRCKLTSLMDPKADMVRDHLLVRGFMDGYRWEGDEDDYEFVHGISTRNKEGGDHGPDDMEDQDGGPDDEDHEDEDDGPSSMDWVQDPYLQELLLKQTSNARASAREKAKMDQLEVDAVTPLYEGCRPEDTRLKVTLMALQMKVKHKMTDTSFNDNMSFWHERLPKARGVYHMCGVSRYKKGKKAPRKVVWYFPITPRLQRYFADPKQAKLMRWHAEMRKGEDDADDPKKKKKDRMLRHPSDASQWNALNLEYPEFGDDPRNIRLGASTDGVNPFGSQSSTHSTWPVFVWMYNLPPGCA